MTDVRGQALLNLVMVMDRLRSPGGCPWDAQQTHETLLEYLLEEAYETVEAVETHDRKALREELGDVLLQVVFHARVAEDDIDDPFDIDVVAQGIIDKLVRRHPHVFDDNHVDDGQDLHTRWDKMKAAEKARTSVTEGVPMAMPASLLAMKLMGRAKRSEIAAAIPAVSDAAASAASAAITAVAAVAALSDAEKVQSAHTAVGNLLLAVIAQASADGVDAEAALRAAVRDYRQRIIDAENAALLQD